MNFQYKDNENISIFQIFFSTMGETRTHTPLKVLDFESSSATITTLWHIIENKRISVVTFLKSHCDDIPHHQDV